MSASTLNKKGVPLNDSEASNGNNIVKWLLVVLLVYGLLVAVGMIGSGFKLATGEQAKKLFEMASNPFAGLVIGTVATALIQSSSTVTSTVPESSPTRMTPRFRVSSAWGSTARALSGGAKTSKSRWKKG